MLCYKISLMAEKEVAETKGTRTEARGDFQNWRWTPGMLGSVHSAMLMD